VEKIGEKVIITGGAGFIGSALVRKLAKSGYRVFALVRPGSNLWRLVEGKRNYRIIEADITNSKLIKKIVSTTKPAHILHLATNGVYRDQIDKQKILEVNIEGTTNILEASLGINIKSFVNTGSVYEYSDLPGARSEADVGVPRNDYDRAKIESTRVATQFAIKHSLPVTTLRLFTAYGPYEDARRLIPNLILNFLRRSTPSISPTPIRDFVYLSDVARAYILAINKAPKQGEIINIGSGIPISINEITTQLASMFETTPRFDRTDQYTSANDSQCWADISLAQSLLGWKPKYDHSQGLTAILKWFRKNFHLYQ